MKEIMILGVGCPKCKKLAENAQEAADSLGLECEIRKVTDLNEIARMGVIMTPGLVIDGVLKSSGKLLSPDQIKELL